MQYLSVKTIPMKFVKIFVICLLVTACNAPRVVYDYDREVAFNQYSTYSFYPQLQTGLSQLDERRLLSSLEKQLQEEGFSESSNPDMYVNVYTEEFREASRNSLGVGIGGTGRNVGIGVSGGIPLGGPQTILKLTFDFVDVNTDSLIWQAVVESKFDPNAKPEVRQKRFDQIVEKALEGYPPNK